MMAAPSTMRLRHSGASPFVRKVMVFAHECGLADRITPVATDTWDPATDLVHDNPVGKVPTLMTDDGIFIGSLLICEYLDTLHGGARLIPADARRWPVLRLHALADGAMEAAVASVTERLRRPAEFVHLPYVERQHDKVRRTLAVIAQEVPKVTEPMDLGQITLACLLGYLDFRLAGLLDWRTQGAALITFHDSAAAHPSMAATMPRARA